MTDTHREHGDKPPAIGDRADRVACPFCDSTETELFAHFGQFLLASQFYCRYCHSVFDRVRWEDEPHPATPLC